MKNPQKDPPLALAAVLSVTAICLLAQFVVVVIASAVSVFGVAFVSLSEVPLIASTLAEEHGLLPPILGRRR